jgi:hypothetical protein
MDGTGNGVPPLIMPSESPAAALVDLHVHSTASDGMLAPEDVVERAAGQGLSAIALTDHDTTQGVAAAVARGETLGLTVVAGCEFSVQAPWGEMHLLAYFIPPDAPELTTFLASCRADRARRGEEIVRRLRDLGVTVDDADVAQEAQGGAIGRPHVARALRRRGVVRSLDEAFDRFLGRGRPAFVDKALPAFGVVAALVHRLGGVVSAAHLKERGTRQVLRKLQEEGLDAIETRHPSHDADLRARLTDLALELGLARTGGSDWHGDADDGWNHGALGSQQVPAEWLEVLAARRPAPSTPAC